MMTQNKKIIYALGAFAAAAVLFELWFFLGHGHLWPTLSYPNDCAIRTLAGNITYNDCITRPFTVTQSGGSSLLPAECADKNYVANASDYIIEGTVDSVGSAGNAATGIVTYTGLTVEKYAKGTPPAAADASGNALTITTPGGCVGATCQQVEDQPIFHKGKKVRIYLKEENDKFNIVCGSSGVEER